MGYVVLDTIKVHFDNYKFKTTLISILQTINICKCKKNVYKHKCHFRTK